MCQGSHASLIEVVQASAAQHLFFKWVRKEILLWGNNIQICSIIGEISSLHRPSRSNPQTHHYSSVCPMKVGSHALTHLDPEKMNFQWGLSLALFLPTTEHLTLAKHKDHNWATNFPDGRCLLNIWHHRNRFLTLRFAIPLSTFQVDSATLEQAMLATLYQNLHIWSKQHLPCQYYIQLSKYKAI